MSEHRNMSALQLKGNDRDRARYNLATGYTNISYFESMPVLPNAANAAAALERAEEICIALLLDVLRARKDTDVSDIARSNQRNPFVAAAREDQRLDGAPEGRPDDGAHDKRLHLLDRLRAPSVVLLAGIWALRRNSPEHPPSPRWLHLLAMQSLADDSSLGVLLEHSGQITDVDLIDWFTPVRFNVTPRVAYNLACYWSSIRRDDDALRELAVAQGDPKLAAWARNDPALRPLQNRRKDDFNQLFPAPRSGTGSAVADGQPTGDSSRRPTHEEMLSAEPAVRLRSLPAPTAKTALVQDTEYDLQQLNKGLGSTDEPVVVAARRLDAPEGDRRCRLDIWGRKGANGRVEFEGALRSAERWAGDLQLTVRNVRTGKLFATPLVLNAPGTGEAPPLREVDPYLYLARSFDVEWRPGDELDAYANVVRRSGM